MFLTRLFKILLLALHILLGIVLTLILAGIFRQSFQSKHFSRTKQWWLGRVCRLLDINIQVSGHPPENTVLYAANHISWLDIPVLASVINPVFLSKAEIRRWPLIGWLADKAGTLFIQRGNRDSALAVNHSMQQMLTAGTQNPANAARYSILFFPEGTTSDGTGLLRLRPRLFNAAISAKVPIQPVFLYYPDKTGKINPVIPFTGQQSILENLWNVLGQGTIQAEVHFLPPIPSTHKTPKALAEACEKQLRSKFI